MADWYVSSVAFTAIPIFVASAAYTVGNIIRPTTQTANGRMTFRCTTAGTASTEPNWLGSAGSNNNTITTGGATFTNVTGQSAYFWSAPAGDIPSLFGGSFGSNRISLGDRIFVSSDHSESVSGNATYFTGLSTWGSADLQVLSVNRAGSTPPVAADLTPGAALVSTAGGMFVESNPPTFLQGFTLNVNSSILFNSSATHGDYLKNCALWLNNATAGSRIQNGNPAKSIWENTTVQFGATGQAIGGAGYTFDLTWMNTPAAIQGSTIPTVLFVGNSTNSLAVLCRGVDLSAVTTALVAVSGGGNKALFESCKIAPGVVRYSGTATSPIDVVELVNCFDGTKIVNERYVAAGSVVTERTITLSSGAADDVGAFSHKMVSASAFLDKWVLPLEGFWFDVENTLVGSSRTATVEIVSSASLNNDDISLLLEYQGTSGSPIASFASSLPATILTANAAVTTSSATWNSSPSTPAYQKLQVTFTPLVAGRVRGQVRLGKASTTVYVNPQITIT